MDSRSPYLTQALQALSQPAPAPQGNTLDLGAMKQQADARKAWEAANPGQSYISHGFGQLATNLQNLPQTLAKVPGTLAAVPGNIGQSFGQLAKGLIGQGGPAAGMTPPY